MRPVELQDVNSYTKAVCRCMREGHLENYLPRGMRRGRLSTPAMVDEWMKGGSDA